MFVSATKLILVCVPIGFIQMVLSKSDDKFSFKKTFRPPSQDQQERLKRLDDFEILERSSFSSEEAVDNANSQMPSRREARRQYPQFVYYPFIFTPPPWNPYSCNRDREIVVEIHKGGRTTTTTTTPKPTTKAPLEVFCLGKGVDDNRISELTERELKFLADYLDEDDGDGGLFPSERLATTPTPPTTKAPSNDDQHEDIIIKIIERSPPCPSSGRDKYSDNLDFVRVKMSDVIASNASCSYKNEEQSKFLNDNDFDMWLYYMKKFGPFARWATSAN